MRFPAFVWPIVALVAVVSGCTATGPTTAALPGQWSPIQVIGQDRYIVEGYDTKTAIVGGTDYCVKMAKSFEAGNIVPHTKTDRATVTFKCK